jgi:hypothetical protein
MNRLRTACRVAMLVLGTLASAALSTAYADDTGFYVAGSIGLANVQYDSSTFYASSNNVGYQVAAGFRPLPVFSGEFDYTGFPRAFSGINYADTYGLGLFGVGYLPLPLVQVYGKVGLVDWRTAAHQPDLHFSRTGANVAYGGGIATSWGQLGARLEYERFDIPNASQLQLTSVGLIWSF